MRSFVTVAEMGGFSNAAPRLAASQSTISKQVAALESHLKTRLFQRTTRTLALTEEGAVFYERALAALAAIDEAEAAVGVVGEAKGVLRITMPLTLAESRVIEMISRFLDLNPEIEIEMKVSDHALNLVADNLDLAIRVGHLGDSQSIVRKIGVTRRVVVASPDYLGQSSSLSHPSDLIRHNCILYSLSSSGATWSFRDGTEVAVNGSFRADSPNALRAAAIAGIGVAVNARWLFERELANGTLVDALPSFEPSVMPINIVLPSGRYVAARTRALIEFLVRAFAADPLLAPE